MLLEHPQKFFGVPLSMKSGQVMSVEHGKANQCHSITNEGQHQQSSMRTSKERQGEPVPHSFVLPSVGLLILFPNIAVLSSV